MELGTRNQDHDYRRQGSELWTKGLEEVRKIKKDFEGRDDAEIELLVREVYR